MDDGKAIETPPAIDIPGLLEQMLLRPELSETDVAQGCELAKRYAISAVIVRPSDVDLAVRWVAGSGTVLATLVESAGSTAVKTFAVRDMLRRGARQIETVMNTGKLVSRQFQYLEMELLQMADACHQAGAVLNVALENEFLNDELKIVACRVCKRAGVDSIASSALADIPLLKQYANERLKLKSFASTLDQTLAFQEAGCSRLQTDQTAAIVEAWKAKAAEQVSATPVVS